MSKVIYPIEPMQLTQKFGVNAADYARFGLAGHNGWDFRTKFVDSPEGWRAIQASFDSKYFVKGNEGKDGYGIYIEVLVQLKKLWKVTYAHCKETKSFNIAPRGTAVATSDNTGNSTGAHLHMTVKPGHLAGAAFIADQPNNGFKGAVDPQLFFDDLATFQEPVIGVPMIADSLFKEALLDIIKSQFNDDFPSQSNDDLQREWLKQKKQRVIDAIKNGSNPPSGAAELEAAKAQLAQEKAKRDAFKVALANIQE